MFRKIASRHRAAGDTTAGASGLSIEPLEPRQLFSAAMHGLAYAGHRAAGGGGAIVAAAAVATTTTVSVNPGTIGQGQFATVTANVAAGGGSPTGQVLFTVDNSAIAAPVTLNHGTASAQVGGILPPGTYTLGAQFFPDDTSMFQASFGQGTLVVSNGGGGGGGGGGSSELTPTVASTGLPATGVAGTSVRGNAMVSVLNTQPLPVRGNALVEFFAARDGAIDGTEVLLGSVSRLVNLPAGRSLRVPVRVSALPPEGTYTLLARATDPLGQTSVSPAAGTLTVAPAQMDLAGAFAQTPRASKPGRTAFVGIQVTNDGNTVASGLLPIAVEAVADGSLDAGAQTLTRAIRLKPHQTVRFTLPVTLPATPGSYTFVAQLDPANLFADVNLANNTFSSSPIQVG